MPKAAVFLDSAYAIALSAPKDEHHQLALALAESIEAEGTQLITTRAVIVEIGDALSSSQHRQAAIKLLASFERDPEFIEVVPISEQLYAKAFELYRTRPDKEWGMTDCISFIVMQERNMMEALTTDKHFQQAGFRALLRKD